MKIGLDWDGTVNADPEVFLKVVKAFLDGGHEVSVVTWRALPDEGSWPDMEEIFAMWGFKLPIVYCNGQAKRDCYEADIWIDDNPGAVCFSLMVPPRFVQNPSDYDDDRMRMSRKGHSDVITTWSMLNPRG